LNALVLDGSRKGDDALNVVLDLIHEELQSKGYELDVVPLRDEQIADCTGCFFCWTKTPGVCVIDDAGRDIAVKFAQSDLLVFLTPVVFGGFSSELKKALDRQLGYILPFFMKTGGDYHHRVRYERRPRLVAVGVLPRSDEEAARLFGEVVSRCAFELGIEVYSAGVVYSNDVSEKTRGIIDGLLVKVCAQK
jgi:NADPH-dependent FMN reductase